jgi:1,4-alpha-glucan branching enzyme
MWWQLTNKRADEKTVSYAECHDQAMVGDKTIIFRLMDALMYTHMDLGMQSLDVDRAMALHKMIRLVTIATAGNGYLNFMGNEFGHPEWIDFPREGNGWSHAYARRQWSLADSPFLRYGKLLAFDRKMIHLFRENNILSHAPISIYNDEPKQILIMERGEFVFVFNFSPAESYNNYRINIFGGEYSMVLDTDWKEFNGYERNRKKQVHYTQEDAQGTFLTLYLPARTAFVLKRKLVK